MLHKLYRDLAHACAVEAPKAIKLGQVPVVVVTGLGLRSPDMDETWASYDKRLAAKRVAHDAFRGCLEEMSDTYAKRWRAALCVLDNRPLDSDVQHSTLHVIDDRIHTKRIKGRGLTPVDTCHRAVLVLEGVDTEEWEDQKWDAILDAMSAAKGKGCNLRLRGGGRLSYTATPSLVLVIISGSDASAATSRFKKERGFSTTVIDGAASDWDCCVRETAPRAAQAVTDALMGRF